MKPEELNKSRTEYSEQVSLMQQCNMNLIKYPELKWIHAIQNQGHGDTIRGARNRAAGIKKGIADLFLPVKRDIYSGLYVELKKRGQITKLSKEQKGFRDFSREQGFAWMVADSWETAWSGIQQYLNL